MAEGSAPAVEGEEAGGSDEKETPKEEGRKAKGSDQEEEPNQKNLDTKPDDEQIPDDNQSQPDNNENQIIPNPNGILRGLLRKYQQVGMDWIIRCYENNVNVILADEMGLGKTIQTIAVLCHLALEKGVWGPHCIVVPNIVLYNWEEEMKKWAPGRK